MHALKAFCALRPKLGSTVEPPLGTQNPGPSSRRAALPVTGGGNTAPNGSGLVTQRAEYCWEPSRWTSSENSVSVRQAV